jgi:hypothetical protein
METPKDATPPTAPLEDLVEERKPASLLIAQFFLFPLVIIAICVGIFLLFGYLTYDQRSPEEYLAQIQAGGGFRDERRWQAAYELSNMVSKQKEQLRNSNFVGKVVDVYKNSSNEDPRVRHYLALTMGHLGDKRALPTLLTALNDDPQVENQIYTLWALGSIGDNSAVPGVLRQLQHEDPAVRKVAAYVLGSLKDGAAIHDLQVALNDANNEVRWNAAMALAQLDDSAGAVLLMGLLDHDYIERLDGFTAEQKTELMVNAVKCLAVLRHEPAREKISALSQSDPNLAVRDASIEALTKY